MTGVRYSAPRGVFQLLCPDCWTWKDIDTIEWEPRLGMRRCRRCHNGRRRVAHRQTPEQRRANQRSYYWQHHEERLAWRKDYHRQHRDAINALRRARYAEKRAASQPTIEDLSK